MSTKHISHYQTDGPEGITSLVKGVTPAYYALDEPFSLFVH